MSSTGSRLTLLAGLLISTSGHANNCEPIRAQIELKYRAAGVPNPVLSVVDVAATVPGQVVGTCAQGSRKIVYSKGEAGRAAKRKPDDELLTECKDGTTQIGGVCKRK